MATIAGRMPAARAAGQYFHLGMAIAFTAIAFGGFSLTYWSKLASPGFHVPPIVHVHGLLFSTWTLYYLAQTALVAGGRTPDHRSWGLAGISLFSVMACTVIVAEITMMRLATAQGYGEATLRFSAVPLVGLAEAVVLFALAIVHVRRPELHKRFMVLLMVQMMIPAIARVFQTLMARPGIGGGPPPPFVVIPPSLVANLLLLVAIGYDWRTRGRPHRVYAIGGPICLAIILSVPKIAATDTWMALARGVEGLGG